MPADDFRPISMGVIWAGVFVIVAAVLGIMQPWDALMEVVQNKGVSADDANLLGFIAGFTAPLAAGTAILAFAGLRGAHRGGSGPAVAFTVAVVLPVAGWLSIQLGLGLAPDLSVDVPSAGVYTPLLWALKAYFTSYGLPLMVAATTIGVGAAFQVERWMYGEAKK